jgi:undecaprenyl-phosphate galactose phosphotransferase
MDEATADKLHHLPPDASAGQAPTPPGTAPRIGAPRHVYPLSKRLIDLCGAVLLGLMFAPVLLAIWLALLRSGEACLSRQLRIGRGGRKFIAYKFRALAADADRELCELLEDDPGLRREWQQHHWLANDPRLTPLGRLLRESGVEELPQLWNVLRGDMSLIGPRPLTRQELRECEAGAPYYLAVKPGLSGLWPDDAYPDAERRAAALQHYAMHASLAYDLKILAGTVAAVLRRPTLAG